MPRRARYDGLADWYDDISQSSPETQSALDSLPDLLGRGPGKCIDIGCGTGIAFPALSRLDWSVVGIDVSETQLGIARARADGIDVVVRQADAADLPFPGGSFDAAISLLTHTDFDDATAVFREAARVVKIGGRLAYVGVHPCFVGPMVERLPGQPPILRAGYTQSGWWKRPRGVVRTRVGVNHLPLAALLNAVVGAGWIIEHVAELGADLYPSLLGLRAVLRK